MVTISPFIGGVAIDWRSISQAIREQEAPRSAGSCHLAGASISSQARPPVEDDDMTIRETFQAYRQDPARLQWQERKRLSWREAKAARRQMYEAAYLEKQKRRDERRNERLLGGSSERHAQESGAGSLRISRADRAQHSVKGALQVGSVSTSHDYASFTSSTGTKMPTCRPISKSEIGYHAYRPQNLSTDMRNAKSTNSHTSQNRIQHIRREQKSIYRRRG